MNTITNPQLQTKAKRVCHAVIALINTPYGQKVTNVSFYGSDRTDYTFQGIMIWRATYDEFHNGFVSNYFAYRAKLPCYINGELRVE